MRDRLPIVESSNGRRSVSQFVWVVFEASITTWNSFLKDCFLLPLPRAIETWMSLRSSESLVEGRSSSRGYSAADAAIDFFNQLDAELLAGMEIEGNRRVYGQW